MLHYRAKYMFENCTKAQQRQAKCAKTKENVIIIDELVLSQ